MNPGVFSILQNLITLGRQDEAHGEQGILLNDRNIDAEVSDGANIALMLPFFGLILFLTLVAGFLFSQFAPQFGASRNELDAIRDVFDEVLDHTDVLLTVAPAREHSGSVFGELNRLSALDEVE